MKTKSTIGFMLMSMLWISRSKAQTTGVWTWVSGENTYNNPTTYGTMGVPDNTNMPGNRYDGSGWTDAAGNIWVFGGADLNSNVYNDLWEYIPVKGEWEWVSGNSTANSSGLYGASAGNMPGARFAQSGWMDHTGALWIFGGYGFDGSGNPNLLNDLWKFSPGTGVWTWIGGDTAGSNSGNYGTLGGVAPTNSPGGRYFHSSWVDHAGNFWLFGGEGLDASGNSGTLNDLWEYVPGSGQWIWVKGSNTANDAGSYGTQGVAASSNTPPAREAAGVGVDPSGNFWIFGGRNSNGFLNDLWEYNPGTGNWTWVSGSNAANSSGVYGTQGVPASGNVPGARVSNVWVDASGNFWIFGDGGYDSQGTYGVLNDVWQYSPSSGNWAWVAGSDSVNPQGNYGAEGTAAPSNEPPARSDPTAWADASGNFWLMGGYGFNDLWKFNPVINALPIKALTLEGMAKTNGNLLTWQTVDEINTVDFGVEESTDGSSFLDIGKVKAIGNGNNSYSFTDTHPPDAARVFYRVKSVDQLQNLYYSAIIELPGATSAVAPGNIDVFPNPAVSGVTLKIDDNGLANTPVRLVDVNGRVVSEQMFTGLQQYIDMHELAKGVYFLQLGDGTAIKILKN